METEQPNVVMAAEIIYQLREAPLVSVLGHGHTSEGSHWVAIDLQIGGQECAIMHDPHNPIKSLLYAKPMLKLMCFM